MNLALVVLESVYRTYRQWIFAMFGLDLVFTVWAIILQICVEFSDPGIVTASENLNSHEARTRALDLEPEEVTAFSKD